MDNVTVQTPASRAHDPSTSHDAADAITASGERRRQQQTVETTVFLHPGRTSAELARFSALDRFQIARRLSEVETAGRIRRAEARQCRIGGRKALTWWPM